MSLPASLIEDLTTLSDALDEQEVNLSAVVSAVADNLEVEVPSFLGLTVMLHVADSPVIICSGDLESAAVGGSLVLSLLPMGADTTSGSITFYCGTPGAFLALADDVRWIFNLDGRPVLDGHLPVAPVRSGVHGARGPPRCGSRDTGRYRRGPGGGRAYGATGRAY